MTSILLAVTGAKARATVSGPLTSGMVGIPVTIEYDDAWNGLTKNLVCRCAQWAPDAGETRTVRSIGNTSTVAHEVMIAGMHLYLGIEGYSDDGEVVIPTTWADCGKIQPGANADADESTDFVLPFWAQLQTQLRQLEEHIITEDRLAEAITDYLQKNPADPQNPSQGFSGVSGLKTVLGNIMTILKAQVEDANNTPQGYSMDISGLVSQNDTLIASLDNGDAPGDDGENEGEAAVTLSGISVVYSGGDVAAGTALQDLTGIVVMARYSDGSTADVLDFALSGTILEGANTITVTYRDKTAAFTVTGIAESTVKPTSVTTISLCTNAGYLAADGVTVKSQNFTFHSNNMDVATIQSAKTKYRHAYVANGFLPFLFYSADGSFLSGVTGTETESNNSLYYYYEITESHIPAGAKYLKIVLIHESGAKDLDTLMTVLK